MSIGSRIKEARMAMGIGQEELAKRIKVSKGAIGNYETDVSRPKEPILIALMDVLGIDANYLYQDYISIKKTPTEQVGESDSQMNIGDIIFSRRKALGLTLEEIGSAVGVSKSTVKKWETGYIANIKRDKIAKLAKVLRISPVALINGDTDCEESGGLKAPAVTEETTVFPVVGDIAAGYEQIGIEDWSGETIEIPNAYLNNRKKEDFFVLRVNGDSMYPMFQHGDRVLILRQSTVDKSGDIGAIIYDDELLTLKKIEFVFGEDWLRLVPINPEYMSRYIENEALEHCRVIGIPKLLIREF